MYSPRRKISEPKQTPNFTVLHPVDTFPLPPRCLHNNIKATTYTNIQPRLSCTDSSQLNPAHQYAYNINLAQTPSLLQTAPVSTLNLKPCKVAPDDLIIINEDSDELILWSVYHVKPCKYHTML